MMIPSKRANGNHLPVNHRSVFKRNEYNLFNPNTQGFALLTGEKPINPFA
jgi:hypothetical protein